MVMQNHDCFFITYMLHKILLCCHGNSSPSQLIMIFEFAINNLNNNVHDFAYLTLMVLFSADSNTKHFQAKAYSAMAASLSYYSHCFIVYNSQCFNDFKYAFNFTK